MGHLGARVSALLDGQLSAGEAEEAWAHVYACHACRDLVEREGWVKTRLAGLSGGVGAVSPDLKGSLLNLTPGERFLVDPRHGAGGIRRGVGIAVLGGSALGAAMVGVLALGFGPGSEPADRRLPVSRLETPAASEPADEGQDGRTPVGAVVPTAAVDPIGGPAWTTPAAVPAWGQQLIP